MSHKFTIVLNREITGDEADALRKSGCGDAAITTVIAEAGAVPARSRKSAASAMPGKSRQQRR